MKPSLLLIYVLTSICCYGQKTDSVRSANSMIHYEIKGSGDPVYLLSGGPGMNPDYMKPVFNELSNSHQCILIHQRGTGKTIIPDNNEPISIDQYCEDIRAIKQKKGHKKIALLGHSWGGMLAMHYLTKYQEDISKNILVSSGGYNLSSMQYLGDNIYANLSGPDQRIVQVMNLYSHVENNTDQEKEISTLLDEYTSKIFIEGYLFDKNKADESIFMKMEFNEKVNEMMIGSLAQSNWDLQNELKKTKVPTLIIQGRQDPIDLETARGIKNTIPDCSLVIIERCGHFPWIEKPEEFYQAVMEFLKQN